MALFLAVGTALLVGGCANRSGDYDVVTRVSPEQSMLRFNAAAFKDASVERAAYYDVWQYEEFARVNAADFTLEMIYVTVSGDNTAIEYPFTLNAMTFTWRHNAGSAVVWASDHRVRSPITDLWFRRFSLPDRNQSCAAFDAEWDSHADDIRLRPTELVFGYLCAKPGAQLLDASIDSILSGIGIRGITERIRVGDPDRLEMNFGEPVVTPPRERADALTLARGNNGQAIGNPEFPFRLVRIIDIDEGSEPDVN